MFNKDKLDKILKLSNKKRYCKEELEFIGQGATRLVYKLGNDKVLKLIKNIDAIKQNIVEYTTNDHKIYGETLSRCTNFCYIIMKYYEPLTKNKFYELTNVKYKTYFWYMRLYRKLPFIQYTSLYHKLNNSKISKFLDKKLRLDECKISSMGIDENNEIFIIDYGLNTSNKLFH